MTQQPVPLNNTAHFIHHNRLRGIFYTAGALCVFIATFLVTSLLMDTSDTAAETSQNASTGGAAVINPPKLLPDFKLISHSGELTHLSDFRGKAVMLFFGYTHCPDVCPTTLAAFRLAKQTLGDAAKDVEFVFISVDGKRDTPEVLAKYLKQFQSDFIGLTGSDAQLREMGATYGLRFDSAQNFIPHTSPSFLIDPEGYLRVLYFYGTSHEQIAGGLRSVLQEQAS